MMNGYGPGWAWMILMPLLSIAIIALIIWVVIRLVPGFGHGAPGQQGRETPQEILDRRFARGEINAEEYQQARAHLAGREPDRS